MTERSPPYLQRLMEHIVALRKFKDGWGSGVIDRVARDIQNAFPGIEGFSKTNMGRMRAFYLAYSISPQAVGKLEDLPIFNIPWGHNIAIFEGVLFILLHLKDCFYLDLSPKFTL